MESAGVLVLNATDDELARIESVLSRAPLSLRLEADGLASFRAQVRDGHDPDAILLCTGDPSGEISRVIEAGTESPTIVIQRTPAKMRARELIQLGAREVVSMRRLARLPEVLGRTLNGKFAARAGSAELQALFHTVLASVRDVVIVADARSQRIVICNDAARQMFGYRPTDLIGQSMERLFPDHESFVEFSEFMVESVERWGYCNTETMLRRMGNEDFEVDVRFTHLDRMFGLDDCMIGTIRDMAQERSADRAVSDSMERLEGTLNSLQDVVITVDPQTRTILNCNPAVERVFGFSPSEVIGRETSLFFPDPDTFEAFGTEYAHALEQFGVFRSELTVPHRDGHLLTVEITVTALSSSMGWREGIVATIRDVTQQRQAQEKARLAESVVANTVEAVMITDLERRIISVNAAFEQATGYGADEIIGRTPDVLRSGYHKPDFYREIQETVDREGHWQGEIWQRRKNGEVFPAMASSSVVRDESGRATHYTGIFTDISHHKHIQERLEYLVHYDPLTTLPNRRSFEHMTEDAVARALRQDSIVAVLFLDIDHFKHVNETLGHAAGDTLLRAVADRLKVALRDTDDLARLGGDEFGIIARDLSEPEAASTLAKRLLQQLKDPFLINAQPIYANASIGISLLPSDGQDFRTLMKNADSALFRAKERGRNSYEFFSQELNARAFEALVMLNSLRRALEQEEFLLHFQPRVSATDGRIVGAEALVRWQHPELGMTMPNQFIPIAEQTGLIGELGTWVIKSALESLVRWRELGIDDLRLSINLSAKQFADPELAIRLRELLSNSDLQASNLELEVTESMLVNDPPRVIGILEQIRDQGISVTIDDFGTGYSSLNYLKQFPINGLKIDQSFISGIPDDQDDVAITRAIIAMARSLNLHLVAEGVEKQAQADFLRRSGCHELQGFLYSPAVPEESFIRMISRVPRNQAAGQSRG